MALSRAHVTDTAVTMIVVIPTRKFPDPLTRMFDRRKTFSRELRSIFDRTEQRFDEGIVVTDPRTRVGRTDSQPCQHRQDRSGLESGAVVSVQHGLRWQR